MSILPMDSLHSEWATVFEPAHEACRGLETFLATEQAAGRSFLPHAADIFRAFRYPISHTRVVIVGQDPYPTPGHSMGLAFSVEAGVRPLPRSLTNIYRELSEDLGIAPAVGGDLSGWDERGVLLLNRVLTVSPGSAGSHRGRGWETLTDLAISALVRAPTPVIAILWGKDAARLRPLFGASPVIESAHPSPLSASRGFWGSKPFSRANAMLRELGQDPIDWRLE